ncbi:MAG: substrate-binding domain-containing protein [Oscillospiraceae bacterium]|jgi:ribose transport system substrate-binding protein|nr:substrate-binding domain-containing protein [Oscillospiraceae bacterium]
MKKYIRPVVFAAACLSFIIIMFLLTKSEEITNRPRNVQISVILSGSRERWRSLERGIYQACGELKIEKPFVAESDELLSQTEQLNSEIAKGANGFIIFPEDSRETSEYLLQTGLNIPAVIIDGSENDSLPANNAEMAAALAESAAESGGKITLLTIGSRREDLRQRADAFSRRARELGAELSTLDIGFDGDIRGEYLAVYFSKGQSETVVALDNDVLEVAAAALPGNSKISLYGFGNSDKVIYALDHGRIKEICFQNEFSLGYSAMIALAEKMGINTKEVPVGSGDSIAYRLISRENMYDLETERLIFPLMP